MKRSGARRGSVVHGVVCVITVRRRVRLLVVLLCLLMIVLLSHLLSLYVSSWMRRISLTRRAVVSRCRWLRVLILRTQLMRRVRRCRVSFRACMSL